MQTISYRFVLALISLMLALPFGAVAGQSTPAATPAQVNNLERGYSRQLTDFDAITSTNSETPKIVRITLFDMDSERAAETWFDELQAETVETRGFVNEGELPDLGDEALLFQISSDANNHWGVLARHKDIVILATETGGTFDGAIAEDIVAHILATGPSTADPVINKDGKVTGGWANAFPGIDEIEGLENMKPGDVVDMHAGF